MMMKNFPAAPTAASLPDSRRMAEGPRAMAALVPVPEGMAEIAGRLAAGGKGFSGGLTGSRRWLIRRSGSPGFQMEDRLVL